MQPSLFKILAMWRTQPHIVHVRLIRLTDAWHLRLVFDDLQHSFQCFAWNEFDTMAWQMLTVLTQLHVQSRNWLRVECQYVSIYDQRMLRTTVFEPCIEQTTPETVAFEASV